MSKKSNKVYQPRRMAPAGSRTGGKTGSKPAVDRRSNGRAASSAGVRSHPREAAPVVNLLAVRIVGGAFALILLAAVVVALVVTKVEMNAGSIVTMALVGVLVALGIFAALQPQVVAGWVKRLGGR